MTVENDKHSRSGDSIGQPISGECAHEKTSDRAAEGGGVRVVRMAANELERQLAAQQAPGLYLVATPIGNLGDISLRALAVLARADVIYCEDTRHSRTLAQHFGLSAPLKPYHDHNADQQRPRVLADLAAGRCVALISDAGTPLVSDPGYKLVREAIAGGHQVLSLPGASAALAALTIAGLPTDAFMFAGFLPPRSAARQTRLDALRGLAATLVFYEAPSRLAETLADLHAVLGPRSAVVARELTKLHEECVRGRLDELAQTYAGRSVKGEIVILVGPPEQDAASDDAIRRALVEAMREMRLKDAAKAVADALGVPKGRVYDVGLKLKDAPPDQ